MKPYDVLIAGGGISGLYMALKCCEKGLTVYMMEKDSRWGGRIHTIKHDGDMYEAGAARFHKNHKYIQKLIKRYAIETIPLDSRHREYRAVSCGGKAIESPAYKGITEIVKKSKQYPAKFLKSVTFGRFAEMAIGIAEKQIIQASFGYDGEFDVINAYDGVQMFSKDFNKSEVFYICKNGLGSIVDAMVKELTGMNTWEGYLDQRITGIEHQDGLFRVTAALLDGTKKNIQAKTVVLALPKAALLDMGIWNQEQQALLNTVEGVACERIYAKYKTPWYDGIRITTTDIPIRQFIPITDKLAMVSYSDSKQAQTWNNTVETGTDALTRRITRQLKELFPELKVPSKPLWMEAYHWEDAIHMWKPNVNSSVIRKQIQHHLGEDGLYICGEAYCSHQCWVDGALQTVEQVLPSLSKKLGGKQEKGGAEKTWQQWVKAKNSKLNKKDLENLKKLYPDAKWVLFKDQLIDLTEWYYRHPGGQTPYDNHMHKNIYPFFTKISNHYDGKNIKNDVMGKIKELTIAKIV